MTAQQAQELIESLLSSEDPAIGDFLVTLQGPQRPPSFLDPLLDPDEPLLFRLPASALSFGILGLTQLEQNLLG